MRLIDADELKTKQYRTEFAIPVVDVEDIDNAETIEPYNKDETYIRGYDDGFTAALRDAKKGGDIF